MRVIHLCFQLHEPYALRDLDGTEQLAQESLASRSYFDAAQKFAEYDEKVCQPLFALLERNIQKHRDLRFSLQISGLWLELAERYDQELINRLKKMMKTGRIELIAEPYAHSLAFFYDQDEMTEQIELSKAKMRKLFDKKPRFLAMPDLLYNNVIAQWAEKSGFAGMLMVGSAKALGRRSPNHVYEAKDCQYLRVLVNNSGLVRGIGELQADLLVEHEDTETGKKEKVLSATKFIKKVELAVLRGGLINMYFDARIFAEQRQAGIVRFFDDLFKQWLADTSNCFLNAAEAVVVEEPTAELDIPKVVGWPDAKLDQRAQLGEQKRAQLERKLKRNDAETGGGEKADGVRVEDGDEVGSRFARNGGEASAQLVGGSNEASAQLNYANLLPILAETTGVELPLWLRDPQQTEAEKALYGLRREVLASEDKELVDTFRRLTAMDYILDLDEEKLERWQLILRDLRRRVHNIKKAQAVEISRTYTKKRERVIVEESSVEVPVQSQPSRPPRSEVVSEEEAEPELIPVHRVAPVEDDVESVAPEVADVGSQTKITIRTAQEVKDEAKAKKAQHRAMRKIIRKLVIE